MTITESVVLIPVPEAEDAVNRLRERLDPAGALRVPAHITVLYPFVPPSRLDDAAIGSLAEAIASVPAFEAELTRVEWFDEAVLWLAPEPAERFGQLTDAVRRRFPGYLPYGGAHGEPVPHLTVGAGAPIDQLRAGAKDVIDKLPIRTRVGRALLMQGLPDARWQVRAELPLG
jgi:2'-5' RNA ligase